MTTMRTTSGEATMTDPRPVPPVPAITEAELAEALKAYSALGMSPAGFAKALFRDVRVARPADGPRIDAPGSGTDDTGRDSATALGQAGPRTGAVEAFPVAAAFDREAETARLRVVAAGGARAVRRAIDEAVSAERERAEAAERKLAAIAEHCRKHADWVNLHCPDLGRPAEALVKVADILAITGSKEESDA